jgi:hypothetical protein
MAQKILVTNFTFDVPAEEFESMATQLAPAFSEVPGCTWKIWLIDRESKQAGAVYLFKDDVSLQNFKQSPLVASVLSHPALSNFDLKERDILVGPSEVNNAPLQYKMAMA